jgi:glycosyltransferase involved in cell wall biosynthesis
MRILFVHKQILFPRDTGGKIRVLNLLKHLGRWHEVTYVANLRPGEEKYLPQMKDLGLRLETVTGETSRRGGARFYAGVMKNLFSRYPFTISRNYDPQVRSKIEKLLSGEPFDLAICDTIVMARHMIGLPMPACILLQHNVEAQILRRHAEISKGFLKRRYMSDQRRKMVKFERECGKCFDTVIAISELDKLQFEREYGWNKVHAIDTAVDEDFFQNDGMREIADRVVFLGSMDWMPNQDGVGWFVREVWPRIRRSRSSATFHIVGRNPPTEIRKLSAVPGVFVVGGVDDIRPYLAEAAVVVVPLLVGGGTRLKIYEAMAMNRAVVSTRIGAEGLPVVPDEHYLEADEPPKFAEAVLRLLTDAPQRLKLGQTADRFVRERYGSEKVARQFEEICIATVANRLAKKVGA